MKLSIESYLYKSIWYKCNLAVANPYGNGQKPKPNRALQFFINILNDLTINIFGNGEIVRITLITDVVEGIYKSIFTKVMTHLKYL